MTQFLGRGLARAAAGIGCGALVALWLTRALSKLLYGVEPRDPATFAIVGAALLACAAAAIWLAARKAMSVEAAMALRAD